MADGLSVAEEGFGRTAGLECLSPPSTAVEPEGESEVGVVGVSRGQADFASGST